MWIAVAVIVFVLLFPALARDLVGLAVLLGLAFLALIATLVLWESRPEIIIGIVAIPIVAVIALFINRDKENTAPSSSSSSSGQVTSSHTEAEKENAAEGFKNHPSEDAENSQGYNVYINDTEGRRLIAEGVSYSQTEAFRSCCRNVVVRDNSTKKFI